MDPPDNQRCLTYLGPNETLVTVGWPLPDGYSQPQVLDAVLVYKNILGDFAEWQHVTPVGPITGQSLNDVPVDQIGAPYLGAVFRLPGDPTALKEYLRTRAEIGSPIEHVEMALCEVGNSIKVLFQQLIYLISTHPRSSAT